MGALGLTAMGAAAQTRIIYVDANLNVPGAAGTSWLDPFQTIDSGLLAVLDPVTTEIWVAQGSYTPGIGAGSTATFAFPSGLKVYGAFKNGDPSTDARTGSPRLTVMTGNLTGDMDPSNNAFHVVTIGAGTDEVLIDGFSIQEGTADGATAADQQGAGILCVDSDLRIVDCFVHSNRATRGAGIWFDGGNQGDGFRAYRTTFLFNAATQSGGAIDFHDLGTPASASPFFTVDEPSWLMNCTFTRNLAGSPGQTNPVLAAQGGGAIHFDQRRGSAPLSATDSTQVTAAIYNCRFVDNVVYGRGAACWLKPTAGTFGTVGRIIFSNCSMAFNSVLETDNIFAGGGGTVFVEAMEANPFLAPGVANSIVVNTLDVGGIMGIGEAITGPGSDSAGAAGGIFMGQLVAVYSDIYVYTTPANGGVYGGAASNINVDPQFVAPAFRDLRLQGGSLCKDTGVLWGPTLLTTCPDWPDMDSVHSTPANDDDTPHELITPNARIVNSLIDMGCHEVQTP